METRAVLVSDWRGKPLDRLSLPVSGNPEILLLLSMLAACDFVQHSAAISRAAEAPCRLACGRHAIRAQPAEGSDQQQRGNQ